MDSELKKLCKMDSTSDIIGDMEQIINRSRNIAYLYVNRALVLRNWLIGRRIDQEIRFFNELCGNEFSHPSQFFSHFGFRLGNSGN